MTERRSTWNYALKSQNTAKTNGMQNIRNEYRRGVVRVRVIEARIHL